MGDTGVSTKKEAGETVVCVPVVAFRGPTGSLPLKSFTTCAKLAFSDLGTLCMDSPKFSLSKLRPQLTTDEYIELVHC